MRSRAGRPVGIFCDEERRGRSARRQDATTLQRNDGPTATIVFHGDRDTTVNKRNGDRSAEEFSTRGYAKRVEGGQTPGGRAYTQTVYADASGRNVLEQWSIHGAGHAWSGESVAGSY